MIKRRGPERIIVGDREITLPPGLSRRDRREAERMLEDRLVESGELSDAAIAEIVRKRIPEWRRALRRAGRTKPRPPKKQSAYKLRERDWDRMGFVKTLPCTMTVDPIGDPTPCRGPIEADHESRGRGLSRKSADDRVIPLCDGHHDERTDHNGAFKNVKRDDERAWFERAIDRAQRAYDARREALASSLF